MADSTDAATTGEGHDLPPIGSLTQRQQRGMDCVHCSIPLRPGAVIDLGPRILRKGDWDTQWFPRCCLRHGGPAT